METKKYKYVRGIVGKITVFQENTGSFKLENDSRFFKSKFMNNFEAINEGDDVVIKYNESVFQDKTYNWISNIDYASNVSETDLAGVEVVGASKPQEQKHLKTKQQFTNGNNIKSREEAENRAIDDNMRVASKLKDKFNNGFGEINEHNISTFNTVLINTFHKLR